MDFDERQEQKRRQLIRVIIAEAGMVLAIIATVIISLLITMGFGVNLEGQITQSGLIQIHSVPTGASVTLDGNTLFSRTNLSRSLSAGNHNIKITRDGYDAWEKDLWLPSGRLVRLYYPRLFLLGRTPETILKLGNNPELYSSSRDRNYILTAPTDSTEWQLIDLTSDTLKSTKLDLAKVLPFIENGKFLGHIDEISWSNGSDHILLKVSHQNSIEWLVINLKNPASSLNLTATFGRNFEQVVMIGGSANQLYVLEDHQLRRIDTAVKSMTGVLIDEVERFAIYANNLIYLSQPQAAASDSSAAISLREIGVYRNGEEGATLITTVPSDADTLISLSHYYDQDYIAIIVNRQLTIYSGILPSYDKNRTTPPTFETLVSAVDLELVPNSFTVSPEGEYLIARNGQDLRVIDLDLGDIYSYSTNTANFGWLDSSMMFSIQNGELSVWDFDYTNYRTLVSTDTKHAPTVAETTDVATENPDKAKQLPSVTTFSELPLTSYPALITGNNRWLYYVVQDDDHLSLRRERIWQ